MGGGSSNNSGRTEITTNTFSTVNSGHTNHNEFGNQQVNIGRNAGPGTSISFSNLALLGQDPRTFTPLRLPQE